MSNVFSYPLTQDLNKNNAKMVFKRGKGIRFGLRPGYRRSLTDLAMALECFYRGVPFKPKTKTWLNLKVFKPNNRSDAVNFVDGISDALKKAIKIDDRYYSMIIDWEIDKEQPRFELVVWQ